MATGNGTTPVPLDTSANVSFTGTPSPVPQIQGQYSGLESGYTNAINAQPTVQSMTNTANSQFGVPQLQQQQQADQAKEDSLNTQINNMGKTVGQASQQSIMTDGQKQAAVQNMTTPLQQQLATATTDESRTQNALGTAQTNASQQVAAGSAQETKQLLPWTQAFSDANVTTAMQMTGWTTENSQQLQVLLANQQAGVTLTQNEQDHLEALAAGEQQFENSLKLQQDSENNSYTAITPTDVGLYNKMGQTSSGSAWS